MIRKDKVNIETSVPKTIGISPYNNKLNTAISIMKEHCYPVLFMLNVTY